MTQYNGNLSWKVIEDQLIFTGEWEESLKIDISGQIAVSNSTGKVYRIYPAQASVPDETVGRNVPCAVRVEGSVYCATGKKSTVMARCGNLDGQIISSVAQNEMPTEDNQSNFGEGFGYQFGPEKNTIEIYMNDDWWVFATEENE